jgi:hypothetical protein
MIDRFFYKFFGLLDDFFDRFISDAQPGDYIVALEENRPVDDSVITLMKMSVTGLIGVIGGYIGGSK